MSIYADEAALEEAYSKGEQQQELESEGKGQQMNARHWHLAAFQGCLDLG